MKKLNVAAVIGLVTLFAGCTSTPEFQTGPDAEVTHDGLTRLDKTVLDAVWARTDIDLSGYNKIMFEGVGVEYRAVEGAYSGRAGAGALSRSTSSQTEFQLDAATKKLFEDEIAAAFRDEMAQSSKFTIVDEPGPDVLIVRGGLLDVVSRVPPEGIGRSVIFIDRVGEATLVLDVRDSMSNAIFARAVDRRAAEQANGMTQSNRVSNKAEVRRLGRKWGRILREGLEALLGEDDA